jgi:hypothetical protein
MVLFKRKNYKTSGGEKYEKNNSFNNNIMNLKKLYIYLTKDRIIKYYRININ